MDRFETFAVCLLFIAIALVVGFAFGYAAGFQHHPYIEITPGTTIPIPPPIR